MGIYEEIKAHAAENKAIAEGFYSDIQKSTRTTKYPLGTVRWWEPQKTFEKRVSMTGNNKDWKRCDKDGNLKSGKTAAPIEDIPAPAPAEVEPKTPILDYYNLRAALVNPMVEYSDPAELRVGDFARMLNPGSKDPVFNGFVSSIKDGVVLLEVTRVGKSGQDATSEKHRLSIDRLVKFLRPEPAPAPAPAAVEDAEVEEQPKQVGADMQKLKNSLREGEMILQSGRDGNGKKMSPEMMSVVRRSVTNTREKLGLEDEGEMEMLYQKYMKKFEDIAVSLLKGSKEVTRSIAAAWFKEVTKDKLVPTYVADRFSEQYFAPGRSVDEAARLYLEGVHQKINQPDYDSMSLEELIALKKKKYGNPDIESPMSADEKKLIALIRGKLSVLNAAVLERRQAHKAAAAMASITDSHPVTDKNGVKISVGDSVTIKGKSDFYYIVKTKEIAGEEFVWVTMHNNTVSKMIHTADVAAFHMTAL